MIGFSRLVPRAVLVLIATIAFVHRLPGQERSKADHISTFILRPGFRQIRKCTSRGPILRRDRFVWRKAPAKRRRHSCGSYRAPAVANAAQRFFRRPPHRTVSVTTAASPALVTVAGYKA